MNRITLLSPAKVNLVFEILEKRDDGYHEIRTLIQPVDIFDEVDISLGEGEGIEIQMTGLDIENPEDNIAYRAANSFLQQSGIKNSVKISIKKKIPAGAGLGGGSSNAASVLVGLNRITNAFRQEKLMELASELGADVPVFIMCATSYAEGIGEKITPLRSFPLLHYIIIYPGFAISTSEIYEKWDNMNNDATEHLLTDENKYRLFTGFHTAEDNFPLYNDLEKAAFELYPKIKYYKGLLESFGAKSVLMSGSGSAVYAVFREQTPAREIHDYLKTSKEIDTFLAKGIHGWHRLVS